MRTSPRYVWSVIQILCAVIFAVVSLFSGFAVPSSAAEPTEADKVASRAKEIVPMLEPKASALLPSIEDRAAWKKIAQLPEMQSIPRHAAKRIGESLPELTEELYMQYTVNGNRSNCQNVLNQRHGRIHQFVLAECIENQGRFIPEIERLLKEYCSEPSWVLPAHDSGNTTWYGTETTIDLASSAFCWVIATVNKVMEPRLSTEVRQMLAENLENRCFKPFESCIKAGKPKMWWVRGRNNWNAVCLAGVTGTALAVIDDPVRRAWYVAAGEYFSQYSMQGFSADGYCSEGLGYWGYGFGNYVELTELIRRATNNKICMLDDPFCEEVAKFPLKIRVMGNVSPAFADCGLRAKADTTRVTFLAGYYGWDAEGYNDTTFFQKNPSQNILQLPLYSLNTRFVPPTKKTSIGLRNYFDKAGILVCRPCANPQALKPGDKDYDRIGVAMKGGHNGELHNHNDVGSYAIVYRNEPILSDVGSEVYTKRTFSSRRYESRVLNSWGHPVPIIDGKLQNTGNNAKGTVLQADFSDQKDVFRIDYKVCYSVPELEQLERTFVYDRQDNSVVITDEIRFAGDVKKTIDYALTTIWDARKDGSRIIVGPEGKQLQAGIAIIVDGKKITDWPYSAQLCNEDQGSIKTSKRLGIALPAGNRATIIVTVKPMEDSK